MKTVKNITTLDFVPNTQNTPAEKVPKNRRKQAKMVESKVEMKEFIDSNNWGYDFSYKTKYGLKKYYHCKKSKSKACKAGIEVLCHTNGQFIISKNENDHSSHDNVILVNLLLLNLLR
jgi:hypothetical protein